MDSEDEMFAQIKHFIHFIEDHPELKALANVKKAVEKIEEISDFKAIYPHGYAKK